MIRAVLISLTLLTQPAVAQTTDVLDFSMLRQSAPDLDRMYPTQLIMAAFLARDRRYYEMDLATSPITSDIADYLVGEPYPDNEKLYLAIRNGLAEEFTHTEILALWFPIIDFGNGCSGIDAAIETLIGKPIEDGSLADFVTLMSLTITPKEDLAFPDSIDAAYRELIQDGIDDGFLVKELELPLLEDGPSIIISSNFCNL